jgi:beta-glucosidase
MIPPTANNAVSSSSICYSEGIYYGYKWYETADQENYFNGVTSDYGTGYDAVVQYPFGYGLNYGNDFTWKIKSTSLANGSALTKESKITFTVTVTNNSAVAGKDVVELYLNAPYTKGGIEKAAVQLVDFAKTAQLAPGSSQDLTSLSAPMI